MTERTYSPYTQDYYRPIADRFALALLRASPEEEGALAARLVLALSRLRIPMKLQIEGVAERVAPICRVSPRVLALHLGVLIYRHMLQYNEETNG